MISGTAAAPARLRVTRRGIQIVLGLLWLLNGRRLLTLEASTAIVQATKGSTVTFYRLPSTDGRVLACDLSPAMSPRWQNRN